MAKGGTLPVSESSRLGWSMIEVINVPDLPIMKSSQVPAAKNDYPDFRNSAPE